MDFLEFHVVFTAGISKPHADQEETQENWSFNRTKTSRAKDRGSQRGPLAR